MQGGRSDDAVLGSWAGRSPRINESEEDSGYESEIEVTNRLSLGRVLDEVIHACRVVFAVSISLPIAWLTGHSSIGSFRARKRRVVEEGTKTVVAFQKATRCKFGDVYFGLASFCAEEEFYLLVLPCLIWNIDRILGRRFTLIVCLGLLSGNLMKDVFGLPRPKCPPVWRPSHQAAVDSSNLQDFGFPSTHAMNALTNSVIVLLYTNGAPLSMDKMGVWLSMMASSREGQVQLGMTALYFLSITVSRLYVGAHTPTDLRGGIVLGLVAVAVYYPHSEVLDEFYLTTNHLELKLLMITFFLLLLHPQPRPPTPTFHQNSLCWGLIMGLIIGMRHYSDLGSGSLGVSKGGEVIFPLDQVNTLSSQVKGVIEPWALVNPRIAMVVRTILGFLVVIGMRVVSKTLITLFLHALGIATKSKVEEVTDKKKRRRLVRIITRDIDILGVAFQKVAVYTTLAWSITYLVPVLFSVLGFQRIGHEPVIEVRQILS